MKGTRGFTLVELMAAAMLAGAALLTALPLMLMARKHIYFVPFRQDDPEGKPTSLVADMTQVTAAIAAALEGRQLQPVLLGAR